MRKNFKFVIDQHIVYFDLLQRRPSLSSVSNNKCGRVLNSYITYNNFINTIIYEIYLFFNSRFVVFMRTKSHNFYFPFINCWAGIASCESLKDTQVVYLSIITVIFFGDLKEKKTFYRTVTRWRIFKASFNLQFLHKIYKYFIKSLTKIHKFNLVKVIHTCKRLIKNLKAA